jgi:drug/metabolite transporter (DMT)-like permease
MEQTRSAYALPLQLTAGTAATAALIFATSAWGGLFHAGKLALATVDPYWFTALRYLGATLMLLGICASRGGIRWQYIGQHAARLFSLGLLGYGFFGILVFVGLSMSVPSHGAVIMATLPLTSLLMRWVLDGQRPAWWAWAGCALAMFGVGLVSGVWFAPDTAHSTLAGDLIAWLGTLGWALYTRGQAKLPGITVIEYTAYTAVMATPALFVFAALLSAFGIAHPPTLEGIAHALPALVYVVAVGTVLAALAYNFGVRTLGATHGILFINLVPVSALIIGAFRGAMPHAAELAGVALVCTALVLVARRMAAKR